MDPDEHLPTYGEALLDRAKESRRANRSNQQPSEINLVPQSGRPQGGGITGAAQAKQRPGTTAVLGFCAIIGFAIVIAGITRLASVVLEANRPSGYHYVTGFSNPSPPYASLDDINTNKSRFLGYTIGGTVYAYPWFFLLLLVSVPQMFCLPRKTFTDPAARAQAQGMEEAQRHKKGHYCMGICCGLSALYVTIVVMALWGTIHLAGTRLDAVMEGYAKEDWAGKFILMEKTWNGSTATFYSPLGTNLGEIEFSEVALNWSMSLNNNTINTINYLDANSTVQGIQLTAFCRHDTNNTSQKQSCIFGSLTNDPPKSTKGPAGPPSGEFQGDLNLTLSSPNRPDILNTTIHLSAGNSDYQGIGKNYAPLGYWYLDTAPVIHVIWNSTQNRACDGLRINLSQEYEDEGLALVGMVWEWWKLWSENGGCSWASGASEASDTDGDED